MKSKNLKITLIGILSFVMLFCVAGFLNFTGLTSVSAEVSAETEVSKNADITVNDNDITIAGSAKSVELKIGADESAVTKTLRFGMVEDASLRLEGKPGLRFSFYVASEDYNNLMKTYEENFEMGAFIIPKDLCLVGTEYVVPTLETPSIAKISAVNGVEIISSNDKKVVNYNIVLVDGATKIDSEREMVAVGYAKVNVDGVDYVAYTPVDLATSPRKAENVAMETIKNATAESKVLTNKSLKILHDNYLKAPIVKEDNLILSASQNLSVKDAFNGLYADGEIKQIFEVVNSEDENVLALEPTFAVNNCTKYLRSIDEQFNKTKRNENRFVTYNVYTDDEIHQYQVKVVSGKIETAEDFSEFLGNTVTSEEMVENYNDGYYLLAPVESTADGMVESDVLDLTGSEYVAGEGRATKFNGVFDGNGKTVKGLTIDTTKEDGSIFGSFCGIIKDISFLDVEAGLSGGVIARWFYEGEIRNSFFKISRDVGGGQRASGLFYGVQTAEPKAIKDSVLYYKSYVPSNEHYAVYGNEVDVPEGTMDFTNFSVFSNRTIDHGTAVSENDLVAIAEEGTQYSALINESILKYRVVVEDLTKTKTAYVERGVFGAETVAGHAPKWTMENLTGDETKKIESISIVDGDPSRVGKYNIAINPETNAIPVDALAYSDLAWQIRYKEHYIAYNVSVSIVDLLIKNADEFINYVHLMTEQRVALADDIEFADGQLMGEPDKTFTGIIDGAGHTVNNMVLKDGAWGSGMFYVFAGTMKNIAFTNVVVESNTPDRGHAVLGVLNNGPDKTVLKNIFIQGKAEGAVKNQLLFYSSNEGSYCDFDNVVISFVSDIPGADWGGFGLTTKATQHNGENSLYIDYVRNGVNGSWDGYTKTTAELKEMGTNNQFATELLNKHASALVG